MAFFVSTLETLAMLDTIYLLRVSAMGTYRLSIPPLLNNILAALFFSLKGFKKVDQRLDFRVLKYISNIQLSLKHPNILCKFAKFPYVYYCKKYIN